MKSATKKLKAVGLLSGGLDSVVAAKLILDQGIEVHAVHIAMPWGCGRNAGVIALAEQLGIALHTIPLSDDYLSILKDPKYGFGSAHNPCIDCHIYMVRKAAAYMHKIGASFVFTGEVLGQRPMSQRRKCLDHVEQDAGIPGLLLRPLSAKLLPPTIPEEQGMVDREKLLGITGRSRKTQLAFVMKYGIKGFATPSGGCLLTEKIFGVRLKDVLKHGCADIAATAVLGSGRYFRVDEHTFIILGRDQVENESLMRFAMPDDMILRSLVSAGPVALLRCKAVTDRLLSLTAGLVQFYSKSRHKEPLSISCWRAGAPEDICQVAAATLNEADVKRYQKPVRTLQRVLHRHAQRQQCFCVCRSFPQEDICSIVDQRVCC